MSSLGSASDPKPLFEDTFTRQLDESWTILREDRSAWRINDGALEIHVQPGDANTVRNALLRPAPDRSKGKLAIEVTVTNPTHPTNQWEQAGLTWYHDDKPALKLVKELVDGKILIVPGHVPFDGNAVQLRWLIDGDTWTAQYRADAKGDFKTAATGKLPPQGRNDKISLQCYHGPPTETHWIRFDDFHILHLPD
jgi:hypothetical protein